MRISENEIQEAASQLERYGFAPNPFCVVCHGYGLVHPRMKDNKVDYSQTIRCKAPGCLAESYEKYKSGTNYYLTHGLTTWSHTFAKFNKVPGTESTYDAFFAFAEGNAPPFLLCIGGVGNGKTFLAEAATIRLLQRDIDAWYYTMANFMSLLHQGIKDNTVDSVMDTFSRLPALVLDDWGDLSDWEEEKLKDLINERYRWHRITCLTSNRSFDCLMQRNERVISRYTDTEISVMVLNRGEDYRPQKK